MDCDLMAHEPAADRGTTYLCDVCAQLDGATTPADTCAFRYHVVEGTYLYSTCTR